MCVEFGWTGRREKCRKCDIVRESKWGKIPLNTAVCHVCTFPGCVVHVLMFMCACVHMCTLDCNQMRVGFYSMCALYLGNWDCSCVCLREHCVCLSISRKQAFLGKVGSL